MNVKWIIVVAVNEYKRLKKKKPEKRAIKLKREIFLVKIRAIMQKKEKRQ